MSNASRKIDRYTPSERANHWIVAICFILLALSGLAFFHPAFFFLTQLFGGGPWARILHPFIGVLFTLAFFWMASRFWRLNLISENDKQWLRQIDDVMNKRDDKLPEVHKYNAGQKVLFWIMAISVPLLLLTGVVVWRPYFAGSFPIGLLRFAVLLHAWVAWILIAGIIVHVYAAIWVKGTIPAMTRGTVGRAWARHHHRAWYREVTGDNK